MTDVTLLGSWWYFNGTGGFDGGGYSSTINLTKSVMTASTDVISNIATTGKVSLTGSSIQTDVRTQSWMWSMGNVSIAGVGTIDHRSKYLSVGQLPSTSQSIGVARLLYFGQKTYSGTIPSGGGVDVVSNKYYPSIMASAVGTASIAGYHPGLIAQVLPANTGNTNYFSVRLTNTTASDIVLTSAPVTVMIWRAEGAEAL